MRLNRGTIALILISLVAIVGVLLLNNSPVNAPSDGTMTPTATPGPLFAGVDANLLTRLEIQNPVTGSKTVLTRTVGSTFETSKVELVTTEEAIATEEVNSTAEAAATDEVISTPDVSPTETLPTPTLDPLITPTATLAPDQPIWVISEASVLADRLSDFTQTEKAVAVFAGLTTKAALTDVKVADVGLDNPQYTLIGTATDGKIYRIDVGAKSISSPGYFVMINSDQSTIYQVPSDQIDALVNLINNPPYFPSPTATLTPSSTPNPYSEVQQTQTAAVDQVNQTATMEALNSAMTFAPGALISTPGATLNLPTSAPATVTMTPTEVSGTEDTSITDEPAVTSEASPTAG